MNHPIVCISLLNWMNYEDTIQCIESIERLSYPNFEIVLCDNASPNNSFELLKARFPQLYIHQTNANNGFAAGHFANYQVAKEKNADLFWILNSDLSLDGNALTTLIQAHEIYPNSIFGSVSLQPSNRELVDFGGALFTDASAKKLQYNSWKGKPYKELKAVHPSASIVESVEGSSMLLPMNLIQKHGFLQLDFFMYAEETDYCYRMRARGINSIVVTDSIVFHHNEGSSNFHPRLKIVTTYYRRRNALRFSHEHLGISRLHMLSYQSGFWGNLKAVFKGTIAKDKEISFYFALACFHAALGIKGKVIRPEDLL